MRGHSVLDAYHLNEPSAWEMRFEDERVKMILTKFKLLRYLTPLLTDYYQQVGPLNGHRYLTFDSFYRAFPTFPIMLSVRCRSGVAEICPPATMFRSFTDVFPFRYYLEVYALLQEQAQLRPIGMVFPFDGLHGGMIVHNGTFDTRSAKMTCPVPGDVPPYRVTVESFKKLLHYLAAGGWSPDSPDPEQATTQPAQVSREFGITPWMIKMLGPGSALVLLGWLRTVLQSPSGYYRLYVQRVHHDRCVAATQEEIVAETGLSERQVQRGLQELRSKQLIATKPCQRRSHIWLSPEALAGDDADSALLSFL